jgi:hypothetical protein
MEAVRTGNILLFPLSLYDYFNASLQFWLNHYVKILNDWLKPATDLYVNAVHTDVLCDLQGIRIIQSDT